MEWLLSTGSKGDEVVELQKALNASRPSALPPLATDGVFGSKTEGRVREFQRLHGLKIDGIVGPKTREKLYLSRVFSKSTTWLTRLIESQSNGVANIHFQKASSSAALWKDTSGVLMGIRRTVPLQPVFLKAYEADIPTGFYWYSWLATANAIWGKLGVTFIGLQPMIVVYPDSVTKEKFPDINIKSVKYYGDDSGETTVVRGLMSGWGVHVFVVDNPITHAGGGDTLPWASDGAKVVVSDQGSPGLLSHELGHVLGLDHPADYGDKDLKPQVMTPAGNAKGPHFSRNPLVNYYRIVWPPPGGSSTPIKPDA